MKAVIELASFSEFNETHQNFLDQLMELVGIVLNTIAATMRTEGLLKQSQLLTQELQARQTELTRKQQELHATNEELQEKAQLLENEKKQVEAKNLEIEMARRALEEKAEQLALTSKYKSEFLANMSHELRTPLNSLLILSKLLSDNAQGNLNEKQVEFARTINSAGSDLLNLINDILDLSKIESGTVTIEVGEMPMQHLKQHMERTFRQLAADKGLDFNVKFDGKLPQTIRTDEKRLQQIVLNLLSNAFKFTSKGSVTLGVALRQERLEPDPPGAAQRRPGDRDCGHRYRHRHPRGQAEADLRGVPAGRRHDQPQIWRHRPRPVDQPRNRAPARRRAAGAFEARRRLDLHALHSARDGAERRARRRRHRRPATTTAERWSPTALPTGFEVNDDRDELGKDPFVLIVEDDPTFATILLDAAHEAGLKGVVSTAGAGTLAMARKLQPSAITLDLGLADIDGFVLLDLLKHDPDTRHMPIHVVSGVDRSQSVIGMGAFGVTEKPAERDELVGVFTRLREQAQNAEAAQAPQGGRCPQPISQAVPELAGAKVLIVDDDIRNIFSLTSVLGEP